MSGGRSPRPATHASAFLSPSRRLILRVVPTSERVGKNEALFREVNERIRDVSGEVVVFDGEAPLQFVCECSDEGCNEAVVLTLPEYEAVRADATHFIVAPGHVWEPDDEHVVKETENYTVVEKTGDAGEVAEEEDSR